MTRCAADHGRFAVYYPDSDGRYHAQYADSEAGALVLAQGLPQAHCYDRADGLDVKLRRAEDREEGLLLLKIWSHPNDMPAGRLNELRELLDQVHPAKAAAHG